MTPLAFVRLRLHAGWVSVQRSVVIRRGARSSNGASMTHEAAHFATREGSRPPVSAARSLDVLSALEQAVVAIDEVRAIATVNRAAADLFGLPHGDVPLVAAASAMAAMRRRVVNTAELEAMLEGLAVDPGLVVAGVTWEVAGPPTRFLRVGSRPIHDSGIAGRVWVFDDITTEAVARREAEQAQHRYRLLAENASDVVVWTNNEGIVEWVSPSLERVTGWQPAQLIGRPARAFVHPDDLKTWGEASSTLVAGEPVVFEARFRTISGGYRWGSTYARPILDEAGEVIGRVGGWRDIQPLRDQWSAVSNALDGMPGMGIAIFDRDLRYRVVRGGKLAFAAADPSWETQFVADVVPPDKRDAVEALYRSALAGQARDFQVLGDDGESTFLVRSRPLPGPNGEAAGGVVMVTDITERVRVETEIQNQNERLVEMDRLKDRMIATVSHELRTPVTSLSLLLEVLADEPEMPRPTRQLVEAGTRSAARLRRLVEDLLLLAEAGHDGLQVSPGPVTPDEIVHEVVAELDRMAAGAGVRVRAETESVPGAVGDRERLAQVVLNLVGNSLKFTPRGGEVVVGVDRTDSGWTLGVHDTGIGIPGEEISHLFDPFYRASTATDAVIGGTGLGLAVVQHIVDAHHGRIRVRSRVGQGTDVEVAFPLDPFGSEDDEQGGVTPERHPDRGR